MKWWLTQNIAFRIGINYDMWRVWKSYRFKCNDLTHVLFLIIINHYIAENETGKRGYHTFILVTYLLSTDILYSAVQEKIKTCQNKSKWTIWGLNGYKWANLKFKVGLKGVEIDLIRVKIGSDGHTWDQTGAMRTYLMFKVK